MKVAIITDQHFGARKGSKIYHDYFQKFYEEVFFPTIHEEKVSAVIDLGDTFDNRKVIDLWSLEWAKKNYYDRIEKLGLHVWTIIGNHTAYYKNTNELNTINVLLSKYENVTKIYEPIEVILDNLKVLFIPWINEENKEKTLKLISDTDANVAMGHLELAGFAMYKGMHNEEGMNPDIFSKFKRVFSGHFHTRSTNGKIFYLGNPYQMYWNDCDDQRGFHIFDTETLRLKSINNPFELFKRVYYKDTSYQTFNFTSCENKYVKLIVESKKDILNYEKFLDKLFASNCHEVKIVENFSISNSSDLDFSQIEDTVSILNKYVEESEVGLNKTILMNYIENVYKEACEVE